MAYGTVNADLMTTSDGVSSSGLYGFKNRIINGAMMIDQRNAGASVSITNTGADTYTLDRWSAFGSQASKFSIQQNAGSVTPPAGFRNYLGATVGASANVTVGASDNFRIAQYIEGFNAADLGWGTSNAQAITLSFWVRSSVTGTYGGALDNSDYNRGYPFTYTISTANTWEYKTITIAGDTTGTWATTNGIGIRVYLGLGVGSSGSGTAGAWAATGYGSATGAGNWISTNSATFYITGVQLEKGSTATSFDYRPYGTELSLCQRYFYNIASGSNKTIGTGTYETSSRLSTTVYLPVTMRTTPTISQTTGSGYYYMYANGGYDAFNSFTLNNATTNIVNFSNSSEASGTAGQSGYIATDNASTVLSVSAEL